MTKSFIPYVGSKKKLSKRIIAVLPEHRCYIEVFGGAGNILLQKEASSIEVINDINKELITLYRVVQNHLEEFIRYFRWALISRDEFKRHLNSNADTLTDIQRAARFFYLQKTTYAGKVVGQTFGYARTAKPKFNLLRIEEELSEIHMRLARVYVECLPYQELIKKYDCADALLYLDPPYHGTEHYYGKEIFSRDDFTQLADILANIKGKFVLSINDTDYVRDVFKAFNLQEVSTTYCLGDNNQKADELLVMNY